MKSPIIEAVEAVIEASNARAAQHAENIELLQLEVKSAKKKRDEALVEVGKLLLELQTEQASQLAQEAIARNLQAQLDSGVIQLSSE
jgi:hypothetical protein